MFVVCLNGTLYTRCLPYNKKAPYFEKEANQGYHHAQDRLNVIGCTT